MTARRPWATPLVPLYTAGLAVKDGLRATGVLRVKKLKWPVVSVGSLSAGGAGKTPVVIALAELLQARGWNVNVLSRGYGRKESGVARVAAEPADAAMRFGDEPVLIARLARVPVWVGADRFAAGAAAEAASPAEQRGVHLLDDGFQHRQLARKLDIVLVTADDLDDALLPAGNRRERFAALKRAEVVVLREDEIERAEPRVRNLTGDGIPIWSIRRLIRFPELAPVKVSDVPTYGHIAFSGIARPENFIQMLRESGVGVIETVTFPDHHAYSDDDMKKLIQTCDIAIGNGFVTTEKDAVKLSPPMRAKLEMSGPLIVARLESLFVDQDEVLRDLEARLS
jgi:tetraacyldisaccharide 4'-kinase